MKYVTAEIAVPSAPTFEEGAMVRGLKRLRIFIATGRRNSFRALLAAFTFLGLLAGCASANNEESIRKQLALSPEQKLQFDRVFFNEIWLWNQTSWRYGQPPSGPKRQQEFEAMAKQGYLPAQVALKMFNFEKQTKQSDKAAFELLRQAADAGDVSSACALMPIWAWNGVEGYSNESYDWAIPYVKQGTTANHFACQEQMALLYRKNVIAAPNVHEEIRLLLRAAEQGYTHAWGVLGARLVVKERPWFTDLDRGLCWRCAQTLYSPFLGIDFGFYRRAAKGNYPQLELSAEQRAEALRLADKWENRMKSAKVIMDIVNECLILERKKLNGND